MAVAIGDQLHAAITERAMEDADAMMRAEAYVPSEDEQMCVEIGIQAGLHAAMRCLAERGWIRVIP
jgi:hypothetical protein